MNAPDQLALAQVEHHAPLRELVFKERLRQLFSHTLSMCLLSVVFASALAFVLRDAVAHEKLAWWLALKMVAVVPRATQLVLYRARRPISNGIPWMRILILCLVLDGTAWGVGCAWLIPMNNLPVVAVIVASLVGCSAISSVVLEADFFCHLAFTAPLMLPSSLLLLLQPNLYCQYGGVGLMGLMVMMLQEGRRTEKRFTEMVTLRYNTQVIAEERARALALAEKASAYKSRFLAQMSHELRTPLHGILGLSRMVRLQQREQKPKEQLQLLERSGRHLLGVINDVLDLSKIEAGHFKISQEVFDLSRLVDDVVDLSNISALRKGLVLVTQSELPKPWVVRGDPARMRQILLNLIGNAIKYTEHGQVTLKVRRSTEDVSRVLMSVLDCGPGITEADQQSIFDAFKQVDVGSQRIPGTGLGLTISRELARAMGGDILCHSEYGLGSEFIFEASLPPSSEPITCALQAEADTPELAQQKLHGLVLLAEDNPVNAIVAQAHLAELGLQVSTVEDGRGALEFVRRQAPDIILMDCQMPVMDGFEATRQIRRYELQSGRNPVPIIALTANALDSDRERCLSIGMNDHLAKPFDVQELRRMLDHHLNGSQTGRQARQETRSAYDFSETVSGALTV